MTDHRLLEIVDSWFSDPKSINEGGYLEICNLLKKNFDSNPDKLKEELSKEKIKSRNTLHEYNELMDDYNAHITRHAIILEMIVATDDPEDTDKKFTDPYGKDKLNYNEYLAKFKLRDERTQYPVIINYGFSYKAPITNEYIMHYTYDGMVWNDIFLQRSCHTHHTRAATKTYNSFSQSDNFLTRDWRYPEYESSDWSADQLANRKLYYNEWHALNRHMNCEDNVLRLLFG